MSVFALEYKTENSLDIAAYPYMPVAGPSNMPYRAATPPADRLFDVEGYGAMPYVRSDQQSYRNNNTYQQHAPLSYNMYVHPEDTAQFRATGDNWF